MNAGREFMGSSYEKFVLYKCLPSRQSQPSLPGTLVFAHQYQSLGIGSGRLEGEGYAECKYVNPLSFLLLYLSQCLCSGTFSYTASEKWEAAGARFLKDFSGT